MTRLRRVPTAITSARALVAALEAGGFKVVERHSTPEPLLSWRQQPLGAEAEIIVRRGQIGSTADDFGFTRGPTGAFEAIVSDIHLSRFDRRWFEKLSERAATLAAAAGEAFDAPISAEPTQRKAAQQPATQSASREAPAETRAPQKLDTAEREEREPSRRASPPVVASVVQDVLKQIDELERDGSAAESARNPSIEIERELLDVLSAARKGGGSLGCGPVLWGWFFACVISVLTRTPQLTVFATLVALALFTRAAKRRTERMALAGAAAFAARFRGNPHLRDQALRRLRAGLASQAADFKPVVEIMLRRLGG